MLWTYYDLKRSVGPVAIVLATLCLAGDRVAMGQVGGQFGVPFNVRPNYSKFSNIGLQQTLNRPTVSPYLNLSFYGPETRSNFGAAPTYQTLVRPQVDAREQALATQRQFGQLQRQVSEIRANPQLRAGPFATGFSNPSRFSNHLHYYPILNSR